SSIALLSGIEVRQQLVERTAPNGRLAGKRQQLGREARVLPDDRWQNVESNSVPQMASIEIGRIVNVGDFLSLGVRSQGGATEIEKRAHDCRLGVETGQASGTRLPEDSHEDRFDLIVESMRSYNARIARGGDLVEKLPSGAAPFLFAPSDGCGASRYAQEPATKGTTRDERSSATGSASRSVVERGDDELSARARR